MTSPPSCAEDFARVYAEQTLRGSPFLEELRSRLPGLELGFVAGREEIPAEHLDPATLYLCPPRGRQLAPCPGCRKSGLPPSGHLCCGYWTLDLYVGCRLGCSYCILRSYLNFAPVTVHPDPRPAVQALSRLAAANPGRPVRVGTGELGDSLELDPLFRLSEHLIRAAAAYPNLHLELKTKTDRVDHLESVLPKGNAVIGFSLNPEAVARDLEPGAAPPQRRLAAARRAQAAGFRVAFHFDPIVLQRDSVAETLKMYLPLAARLAEFGPGRVAWVSLGTFRCPASLRDRLDDARLAAGRLVPCRDGKFRYLQRERSRLYRALAEELGRATGAPVYLCMESAAVWRNVFGKLPREIPTVRDIFSPVHGGQ
jgi:spore photoproduct lyase